MYNYQNYTVPQSTFCLIWLFCGSQLIFDGFDSLPNSFCNLRGHLKYHGRLP